MTYPIFLSCFLALLATSCSTAALDPRETLSKQLRNHEISKLSFWKAPLPSDLPLEDRFFEAPAALIDYLEKDNLLNGFKEHPTSAKLDPTIKKEMQEAVAELPLPIRKKLEERLVGIFFVKDLGGSGYAEKLKSDDGTYNHGILVYDISVLDRKANEWMTWKENTPFQPSPEWKLTAQIELKKRNTRKYSLQYIFMHELAHLLGIQPQSGDFFPPDFASLSWTSTTDEGGWPRLQRRDNALSAALEGITYYKGPDQQVPLAQAAEAYRALATSDFVTLYGTRGVEDDFAESLTAYIHGILLQRPYEITLTRAGKVISRFDYCWEEPRCAAKRAWIERFLGIRPLP